MCGNCVSAERYGQKQAAVSRAAAPNASQPRSFRGHSESRSAKGNKVTGKSFANEPAVKVTTDVLGRFLMTARAAIMAAIANASLCPLAANSTITSGFQA